MAAVEVIFAALLGSLLATDVRIPIKFFISASHNINVNNQGNDGDNVHQTVNINNQDQVANIHNLNGWNSWDSICDYGNGVFATRLYGKRMCMVTKIDKTVFPSLEVLKQNPVKTTKQLFKFNINQVPIANIGIYGVHIDALCHGIPSYTADANQGEWMSFMMTIATANSIITFAGISFCF
ncbi:gastrokine-1-like [Bufo gargarizans]|uniref:gastrokine-1-like n=1 Tax=Bufo gargarizans TaxID=30331 RepID=UPI001CF4425C|nr:gastrokine-1-like [Bufo gargarizans]